jgi:hypothetical protein
VLGVFADGQCGPVGRIRAETRPPGRETPGQRRCVWQPVNQPRKRRRFESSTRHTSRNGPVTSTDRSRGRSRRCPAVSGWRMLSPSPGDLLYGRGSDPRDARDLLQQRRFASWNNFSVRSPSMLRRRRAPAMLCVFSSASATFLRFASRIRETEIPPYAAGFDDDVALGGVSTQLLRHVNSDTWSSKRVMVVESHTRKREAVV